MENEVLELWAAKKKAVLFITHDLDEAIAMSDRVVVLSAGPASHPIGEFADRPRAPARRRRDQDHAALHRAARRHLGRAARRGAQGLRAAAAGEGGMKMWQLRLVRQSARMWQAGCWRCGGLLVPDDHARAGAASCSTTTARRPSSSANRSRWRSASGIWFVAEADIYRHLAVTLVETLLAFGVGAVLGLAAACGWR
jgi:energy-coupling factor transporter ATP-binding protein EcfA2